MNTALHFAAQFTKDKKCIQILLENGADPLSRNRVYETPLDLASRYGKIDFVTLFLESKSDIISQIYKVGTRPKTSPFHLAARSGHKEVCRIFVEARVDINAFNAEGSTALHEATQFGKKDVVLYLLEKGADPSRKNDISQTPLELFNTFNKNAHGHVIQKLLMGIFFFFFLL